MASTGAPSTPWPPNRPQVPVVADSTGTCWIAPMHNCIGFQDFGASAPCASKYARMWPWHNDGMNLGFVDGHVKWYNIRATSTLHPPLVPP